MAVREGLLALLDEGPRHGYSLKTAFEAATGGVWPLNVGQVYTTLERLGRDGLVESSGPSGQRSYRLTPRGVDELGAWWHAVPGDEPPPRDELLVKVLLAVATSPGTALDVITGQRTAVHELLAQRRHQRRRATAAGDDVSLAVRLADDALVVRAESDLRWL